MTKKCDYELSDVPRLLEQRRWPGWLGARAALMDAAEAILDAAASGERAMTKDEQKAFDEYSAQVRDINAKLAEYKRQNPHICGLPF
jgi:hypothetical protein